MKNSFESWFKPEAFTNFSNPAAMSGLPDVKGWMESGRKYWQACAEAQQIGAESLQTVIQRQSEILSQIVQDNSAIAQEIINEGTPEEKIARGAELIRNAYERTVSGMQEVNDICSKSSKEACDVINRRVAASFEEIGCAAREASGKKSKTKKSA